MLFVLRRLTWVNLGHHPLGCRGFTLEVAGGCPAGAESILHTAGPARVFLPGQPSLQRPCATQVQTPTAPKKEKYFQDSKQPPISPSNSPSLLPPSPEKARPMSSLAQLPMLRKTGHQPSIPAPPPAPWGSERPCGLQSAPTRHFSFREVTLLQPLPKMEG